MMINTCSATISTPMGEAEIDALVAALRSGFERQVEREGQSARSV